MATRRNFLATVAGVAIAATGSGCGQLSLDVHNFGQMAYDIDQIATGILGVIPTIGTLSGLGPSVVANISQLAGQLKSVADQASTVANSSDAKTTVQKVVGIVEAIVEAAVPIGAAALSGTPFGLVLKAAQALLPTIEQAVGLLVAPPRLASHGVEMSPIQARQTLALAAQGRLR